ncbi:MAG TPA: hypothetical protein VGR21_09740 [Cryptosporangiaceae bacterium]|nr:hypothetical protein [Cryptosporangiaceae bacterium]
MRASRCVRVLLVLGMAGALGAACGGPETVTPEQWARSVCQAIKPWSAEIARLQQAAQTKITAKSDAAQTKTELIRLFGGMAQSTDVALGKVREAGVPDVESGEEVARQFVQALTAAKRSFATGKDAVAALPTDDPKVFYDGVVQAGAAMSRENANAGKAFTEISAPELDKAFDEVPECQ